MYARAGMLRRFSRGSTLIVANQTSHHAEMVSINNTTLNYHLAVPKTDYSGTEQQLVLSFISPL